MNLSIHNRRITQFILFAAILFLLPLHITYASTDGTIEVQAMVQEGFVEPITIEVTGKDAYQAKLLIMAENSYVLRKQLPNGTYTIASIYTNSKDETDSQMWASTETFEIVAGKTTVLNIAVLDDAGDDAEILFGEENNPFGTNTDASVDFIAENAARFETETTEAAQNLEDITEAEEHINQVDESDETSEFITEPSEEREEEDKKTEKQTAWEKLIDLIVRLARYILLSVLIMAGVSAIVWLYRRMKYGA